MSTVLLFGVTLDIVWRPRTRPSSLLFASSLPHPRLFSLLLSRSSLSLIIHLRLSAPSPHFCSRPLHISSLTFCVIRKSSQVPSLRKRSVEFIQPALFSLRLTWAFIRSVRPLFLRSAEISSAGSLKVESIAARVLLSWQYVVCRRLLLLT